MSKAIFMNNAVEDSKTSCYSINEHGLNHFYTKISGT